MASAQETAQKELDKATADVERKIKLLEDCERREEQAVVASENARVALSEACTFSDWLSQHPALADLNQVPQRVALGIDQTGPIAGVTDGRDGDGQISGQTTVEQQIAAGAVAVDDLFAA